MRFRFVHAADIHLGFTQYNLIERADDFAAAYLQVVEHTVKVRADFMLLAGDLFHHSRADAWMLKQAMEGLETLKAARIPVIAIEGNHDAQHHRDDLSWMQFLCDEGLLTLLNISTQANNYATFHPFDPASGTGGYVDVAGARVYGLRWYGAATARFLAQIAGDVVPGPDGYTILMLHAGMQGQVPNMHGGLTPAMLEPFRAVVDYIALGHVHKRLQTEWIFNPGSTDTNSMDEMDWPHGFFDVQVDTHADPKQIVSAVEIRESRPFRRISVTAEGNESLDDFVALAEERIGRADRMPARAVIELTLGGTAAFRRQDVPVDRLKELVAARYEPLTVRVQNHLAAPGVVSGRNRERLARPDLERQVLQHLIYQNAEYRARAGAWTGLLLDLKNMALEKTIPASIVEHIRHELPRLDALPSEEVPEASSDEAAEPGEEAMDVDR